MSEFTFEPIDLATAIEVAPPFLASIGARGELAWGLLLGVAARPADPSDRFALIRDGSGSIVAYISQTGGFLPLFTSEVSVHLPGADWIAEHIDDAFAVRGILAEHHAADALAVAFEARGHVLGAHEDSLAYELRRLVDPKPAPGSARIAGDADLELLAGWIDGFRDDTFQPLREAASATTIARGPLDSGDVMLWQRDDQPVSMAMIRRRTPKSACISYVYTPREHRGHGYASHVVAALTQRELDAGHEWVSLFTEATNPTSNKIYQAIGYELVGQNRLVTFAGS